MKASAALLVGWILVTTPGAALADSDEDAVPAALSAALRDYLGATKRRKEGAALKKVLRLVDGDLAVALRAVRTLGPLSDAGPGTRHGLTFSSGGRSFEYSIHLPPAYDGARRSPVLVLPDHGAVGPEDGIAFWVGKVDADAYVLFRPVILAHQEDRKVFPDQQFLARDAAIAAVMRDALAHLRLHYAVDSARFSMTGLSQAGYYTWYYALSFPDEFAAIVPESAGGMALVAQKLLAPNLRDMAVRILHHAEDRITPYEHAVLMQEAIGGSRVELITYQDSDYPGAPFPNRHPGPHHLRIVNVLPWAHRQARTIPESVTRVMRYAQQGSEGRWRIEPPREPTQPFTVTCTNADGVLSADHEGVHYRVRPEDVLAGKTFTVGAKEVTPAADLPLLLTTFKSTGDRERLVAAEIRVR